MLRVVFDSECDEELRVGDGVVYKRSLIISDDFSFGDAIIGTEFLSVLDPYVRTLDATVCFAFHVTIDVSEHIAVVATIIAVAAIITAFFMVTVL